jgi:hypothetical protein
MTDSTQTFKILLQTNRDAMMRQALQSESGKRVLVNFLTGQKPKLGFAR